MEWIKVDRLRISESFPARETGWGNHRFLNLQLVNLRFFIQKLEFSSRNAWFHAWLGMNQLKLTECEMIHRLKMFHGMSLRWDRSIRSIGPWWVRSSQWDWWLRQSITGRSRTIVRWSPSWAIDVVNVDQDKSHLQWRIHPELDHPRSMISSIDCYLTWMKCNPTFISSSDMMLLQFHWTCLQWNDEWNESFTLIQKTESIMLDHGKRWFSIFRLIESWFQWFNQSRSDF